MSRERERDLDPSFRERVDSFHLVPNLAQCLTCGKCVGNCPAAAQTPSYNSRQIIQDVLNGRVQRPLQSEEIWRCLWCANCFQVCPVDIHFPLLMMQLRYRAMEQGYGLRYVIPFVRFALRAREDGLTFAPAGKGRERIARIRSAAGMTPWPEVSERARAEYQELFDRTGTTEWLQELAARPENPVQFSYRKGRITGE
ncbi:MAG: 4Fe-4S dicluster domain-containing protein [Syntrophomonadaceae bacterium]|jgi:heterodisulfide reductase subunit C|nr:4Fe-4S dicluster domain-containing protein [Syntrophomonadaceae bacterium]MDH7497463.1 4Fe-4S dicluster domain-containing protein [Syntrophomonadaceae bacterium]